MKKKRKEKKRKARFPSVFIGDASPNAKHSIHNKTTIKIEIKGRRNYFLEKEANADQTHTLNEA